MGEGCGDGWILEGGDSSASRAAERQLRIRIAATEKLSGSV